MNTAVVYLCCLQENPPHFHYWDQSINKTCGIYRWLFREQKNLANTICD